MQAAAGPDTFLEPRAVSRHGSDFGPESKPMNTLLPGWSPSGPAPSPTSVGGARRPLGSQDADKLPAAAHALPSWTQPGGKLTEGQRDAVAGPPMRALWALAEQHAMRSPAAQKPAPLVGEDVATLLRASLATEWLCSSSYQQHYFIAQGLRSRGLATVAYSAKQPARALRVGPVAVPAVPVPAVPVVSVSSPRSGCETRARWRPACWLNGLP